MSFAAVKLPHLDKTAPRLGIAGDYGLDAADIHFAAERGVRFWLWGASGRWRGETEALKKLLARDRDDHVVASLMAFAYTGGMLRRGVEKSLRKLGIDQIDIMLLPWLGRASALTAGMQATIESLKREGKVRIFGTSIHDRKRAGRLAEESVLDALMIRYNAKHPGAEQDIFPHTGARDPVIISYTATSWRQLLKPIKGIDMPAWPGEGSVPPLTPALCYRFCLSSPHVHVTLTAPKTREQLEENLRVLDAEPLSPGEDSWVRVYGRHVKARKRLPFL